MRRPVRLSPLSLLLPLIAAVGMIAWLSGGNGKAVAAAQAEAARLTTQRDSLIAVVHDRERQQAALTIQRETHEAEVTRLRDSVIVLERRRAAAQLSVRQLRTVGALQHQLRTAFPELGASGWGVTTVRFEDGDTLGIEYLMVPAWFAETFVIDHANAESWRTQKDQLLAVDSLRVVVAALQDSITHLEVAKRLAYEAGYQAAYAGYQDLSRRHVAELRKPRIKLASAVGVLGAMAVGVVVGRLLP
ncbi:MAG TPA: hypothetical protein VJL31_16055 [Gemmatimonadales bacterium]|nr:hypothetical protein [Gemmatimonadales bacterium]